MRLFIQGVGGFTRNSIIATMEHILGKQDIPVCAINSSYFVVKHFKQRVEEDAKHNPSTMLRTAIGHTIGKRDIPYAVINVADRS